MQAAYATTVAPRMSAPRFDPTSSLKRVRELARKRLQDANYAGICDSETRDYVLEVIDAEIALQGQVDRAAEMALECVGYREPRFDPNFVKAILERVRYRTLTVAEGLQAISAIKGPEDGAGEIGVTRREIADAIHEASDAHEPFVACGGPLGHQYRQADAVLSLFRRLATRAPSESAPSDEMVERALDAYYGAEARMGAYEMDENEAMRAALTAALSPTPEDQIAREARDEN